MENSNGLLKLDQATRMLAEVRSIDDARNLVDLAEAARVYAKQIGLGLEAQNHAAEIKLRAQRKAGLILTLMEKNTGTKDQLIGPSQMKGLIDNTPTYAEMEISYKDAHIWQKIGALPEASFEALIDIAKNERFELSTAGVYREARWLERLDSNDKKRIQPWPQGKYQVICADPPWRYDNSGFEEAAESQYPTIELGDICNLKVADLCTPMSVLFLWATNPLLPEALQVLAAWGFTYKTNLAWIKDRGRGKGWFLKSKHELLLIGTRGETLHPEERPDSCFEAERGQVHSRKPDLAYQIIERMYGGPRLEMFAREKREGWDAWGNEPNLEVKND